MAPSPGRVAFRWVAVSGEWSAVVPPKTGRVSRVSNLVRVLCRIIGAGVDRHSGKAVGDDSPTLVVFPAFPIFPGNAGDRLRRQPHGEDCGCPMRGVMPENPDPLRVSWGGQPIRIERGSGLGMSAMEPGAS